MGGCSCGTSNTCSATTCGRRLLENPAADRSNEATRRQGSARQPDAVFVPTPPEVVDRMLELAKVGKGDVVYDLGSGDGRIVITAAKKYEASGIGIEMDRLLVQESREEARKQGVQDRVTFREEDLFKANFQDATVVTLYLLPHLNAKLLPQLAKLKAGTRIVAHASPIPGVVADKVVAFRSADGLQEFRLFLWVTPLQPPVPIWPWSKASGFPDTLGSTASSD